MSRNKMTNFTMLIVLEGESATAADTLKWKHESDNYKYYIKYIIYK